MPRWIKWYGPNKGSGSVEDVVSHQPSVKAALGFHANIIYARASANLEFMPELRTGESQVGIDGPAQGRVLDYVIYLVSNDEGGKGAAKAIEIKHGILAEAVGRAVRRGVGS